MSRTMRLVAIIATGMILLLFLLAIAGVVWFDWNNHQKATHIETLTSPDGRYALRMEQIGNPAFFDAADGRAALYETGSCEPIETLRFSVANDGAGLFPENWQVTWEEKRVILTVKGLEEPEKSYELPLPVR